MKKVFLFTLLIPICLFSCKHNGGKNDDYIHLELLYNLRCQIGAGAITTNSQFIKLNQLSPYNFSGYFQVNIAAGQSIGFSSTSTYLNVSNPNPLTQIVVLPFQDCNTPNINVANSIVAGTNTTYSAAYKFQQAFTGILLVKFSYSIPSTQPIINPTDIQANIF
ncbi:hypothetical protein [Leptospira broomii]|uniref:hypothetical protein n=1 Tax=Leptospira broomii TaxID=301541 RepID=UPI000288F6B3|nr:hypothetical protein [Leptospira broomii]